MSDDGAGADEEVLSRALAGEAAAFGILVRQHQRTVFSLALRMLSDRHKAEDLAQEVFLQLHRNLAAVTSTTHLVFWLRKVTVNRAIDRLRRGAEKWKRCVILEEAADMAAPMRRRATDIAVRRCPDGRWRRWSGNLPRRRALYYFCAIRKIWSRRKSPRL